MKSLQFSSAVLLLACFLAGCGGAAPTRATVPTPPTIRIENTVYPPPLVASSPPVLYIPPPTEFATPYIPPMPAPTSTATTTPTPVPTLTLNTPPYNFKLLSQFAIDQPLRAAISSDGKYLAVSNSKSQVLVWSLAGSTQPTSVFENLPWPMQLVFIPGSHHLAVSSCNVVIDEGGVCSKNTTLLFDIDTHRQLAAFAGGSRVAASPDGKYLATGFNSMAIVWDLASGKAIYFTDQQGYISDLAFSPDGHSLAVANPKPVWIYTMGKDHFTSDFLGLFNGSISDQLIAFRPNSSTLFMGGCSQTDTRGCTEANLSFGDISANRTQDILIPPVFLKDLAVDHRGKLLMGAADEGVLIWDLETSTFLGVLSVCGGPVSALAFHPSKDMLAVVCQNGARLYQYTENAGKP